MKEVSAEAGEPDGGRETGTAAGEPDDGRDAEGAATDESDLSSEFLKVLAGILVCTVCGPFARFPSVKTHKSRTKHAMRLMTATERAEEIAMYRSIQAGDEQARFDVMAQRRRFCRKRLLRQGTECAADTSAPAPAEEKEDE